MACLSTRSAPHQKLNQQITTTKPIKLQQVGMQEFAEQCSLLLLGWSETLNQADGCVQWMCCYAINYLPPNEHNHEHLQAVPSRPCFAKVEMREYSWNTRELRARENCKLHPTRNSRAALQPSVGAHFRSHGWMNFLTAIESVTRRRFHSYVCVWIAAFGISPITYRKVVTFDDTVMR